MQQKLDAANRQIEGLKATVVALQKIVDDLQAAEKKTAEDQKKKADAPPAREGAAAKEGGEVVRAIGRSSGSTARKRKDCQTPRPRSRS